MKILITENQLKYLIENINPCPEGTKESSLITLDDIRKGKTISKGYCNTNPNSAIVKIQTLLQNKGLLGTDSYNGYYGNKTEEAVKKLWNPSVVDGTKIGKNTLSKLESKTIQTTTTKTGNSFKITPKEAIKLFNELNYNQKLVVTTLLGEAGGEITKNDYAKQGMLAVANVLKRRAENNFYGFGNTMAEQGIGKFAGTAYYQFSVWNNGIQSAFKRIQSHTNMKMAIYIMNNINSLPDNTGGALYYYTGTTPSWAKNTKKSTWEKTATIGNHIFGNVIPNKKKK